MREYYYLTGLEESPYDLTMADALHLGAVGSLPIYTFLPYSVELHELEENEKEEDTDIYLRVLPQTLKQFEHTVAHHRATGTPETFIDSKEMDRAIVDDRYDGLVPIGVAFWKSRPFEVVIYNNLPFVPDHPSVSIHDLLCWTEDLEALADKGRIKRRADDTSAASNQPDADRQDYPPHLEALTIAWRKFWKNADPADRTTCPKKSDVVDWLTERGFSAKNADAGATIIKPKWAIDKGW